MPNNKQEQLQTQEFMPIPSLVKVQPGDTLSGIATQYGLKLEQLLAVNQFENSNRIYPGQMVRLPVATPYIVQSNDTLSEIAGKNKTTVDAILGTNPQITNPNLIYPGQKLSVPFSQNEQVPLQKIQQQVGNSSIQNLKISSSTSTSSSHLGSLSEKYESNGNPGTVSTGRGDAGGVSYGAYQLTTNSGNAGKFIQQSQWSDEFKGLKAGSSEFSKKWKEVASKDPNSFLEAQHDYIQKTHYDPFISKVNTETGLDVTQRSDALKDVMWSTAVQHGPGNNVVKNALHGKDVSNMTDEEIINAIYDERGKKNSKGELAYFSKNSQDVQDGVAKRFEKERKDALEMLKKENEKKNEKKCEEKGQEKPCQIIRTDSVGLKIKDVPKGQAVAGGHTEKATFALAQVIQNEIQKSNIKNFQYFSAFDDAFHHTLTYHSVHVDGRALDFTLQNGTFKQYADVANLVRGIGNQYGIGLEVNDEKNHPSSKSTGPHIHANFELEEDAKKFLEKVKKENEECAKKQQQGKGGIVIKGKPKNNTAVERLKELVKKIKEKHPDWTEEEIVSQLRRSIPEYTQGIWSMAMPFNKGPSIMEKEFQQEFLDIRKQMQTEMGVDLGHVVASMDIARSFDIIDDTYISWAGDLGSDVLQNFRNGTPMQIGTNNSRASMPDLLGDIDGDNIAHHMPKGYELESLFDYYEGSGIHTGGVSINNRYKTFATDLGLLDQNGNFQPTAVNRLEDKVTGFIYDSNSVNNLRHPLETFGSIFSGNAQFIPTSNVPNLTRSAAEQFLKIIQTGLSK